MSAVASHILPETPSKKVAAELAKVNMNKKDGADDLPAIDARKTVQGGKGEGQSGGTKFKFQGGGGCKFKSRNLVRDSTR